MASVILSACRTPIGRYLGGLAGLSAIELGALAAREALQRAGVDPAEVEETILGNVLTAGLGQAPARQVALKAGVPASSSALTVNMVCGSGLRAVMLADAAIRAGDARLILAGGTESMSNAPHLLKGGRSGWKLGDGTLIDHMLHDGLTCSTEGWPMGMAAEHTAEQVGLSRADLDAFALESQRRAVAAQQQGAFADEIVPVTIRGRKGETVINEDEGPRPETTAEGLAKLSPAFQPDGIVTAGNASTLSDGAAMVVVASEKRARDLGKAPLARIVATATSGLDPRDLFLAPIGAVKNALRKANLTTDQIDLFEINEAFAAQMLGCLRGLELDASRVNIHGGAIALGHPIGASGARVLVTLLHALQQRNARRGLAALCLGGGNAVAMIVERPLRRSSRKRRVDPMRQPVVTLLCSTCLCLICLTGASIGQEEPEQVPGRPRPAPGDGRERETSQELLYSAAGREARRQHDRHQGPARRPARGGLGSGQDRRLGAPGRRPAGARRRGEISPGDPHHP